MRRKPAADLDWERLLAELESPDEEVRGEAVRAFCPCHAGWALFERNVAAVSRLRRDGSRAVRAHALHVFQDAAQMETAENRAYRLQLVEEMTRGKRASRFRPEEAARAARRKADATRRRGR